MDKTERRRQQLRKLIPNAKEVSGSDSNETKINVSLWFTNNQCLCQNQKKNTAKNGITTIKNELSNIMPTIEKGRKWQRERYANNEGFRERTKQQSREQPKRNPETRLRNLFRKLYGITLEQYNEMLTKQNNRWQFVNENPHLLQQNKDCTLTIATKQEKSELAIN